MDKAGERYLMGFMPECNCRIFINTLLCIGLTVGVSFAAVPKDSIRPNILFIAVDDLRPLLGCYGNAQMKTPNIDRLAERGILFESAYCQFSACGPTRASLLTGMYPEHTGVQDNEGNFRETAPDAVSLPEWMQTNGYYTVGMGKVFHHGHQDNPGSRSWSKWIESQGPGYLLNSNIADCLRRRQELDARETAGEKFTVHQKYVYTVGPATEAADVADSAYPDGMLADAAARELRECSGKGQPFFLAVGFRKPHLPLIVPKKYWDMYDPESFVPPVNPDFPKGAPSFHTHESYELRSYADIPKEGAISNETRQRVTHGYYAACSFIDAQIGKVLEEVAALGLNQNTVVVLWGDHGFHLGEDGIITKDTNYEVATHVPLIISGPPSMGMAQGGRSAALVEFVDIFPTLCELTGAAIPLQCDGKSLEPLLGEPGRAFKNAAFSMNRRSWQHPNVGYAMRTERYRYIRWQDPADKIIAEELYDYEKDPYETINLISNPEYEAAVTALRKQFDEERPVVPEKVASPVVPARVFVSDPLATVTDEFNRNPTLFVGKEDLGKIGEGWRVDTTNCEWRIIGQQLGLTVFPEPPNPVLYNTRMLTPSGDGIGFKLAGIVTLKTENKNASAGLVCNYKNDNDQYVFRFNGEGTVQFLRQNSKVVILSKSNAFKHVAGSPYRLTILSTQPHQFMLTLENSVSGEVLFSQRVVDQEKSHDGGYGGVYSSCSVALFDDVVSELLKAK